MSDEELTQAMTDAVIFGTGVMQDGKRIDPLSFFVQPVSDPACEHCGMDPAALTEQLEAARADAKEAEAYAEELEKERDRWKEAHAYATKSWSDQCYHEMNKTQAAEAKLAKAVEALTPSGDTKAEYMGEFCFSQTMIGEDGDEVTVKTYVPWTTIKEIMAAILARATLAEIEGEKG